jgi:SAM-dependent methyltransferase
MADTEQNWIAANRANWDERVPIHLASEFYDLDSLRRGRGTLYAIEEKELGSVANLRILHLQCHIGTDTLALAQRGAKEVVGVDFSEAAVAAAQKLGEELGLTDRARFVASDLYSAPDVLREPSSFDLVYTTWGTLMWLPDVERWANVVAHFLKPGGRLYLADGHPLALTFEDTEGSGAAPRWFGPFFSDGPVVDDTGQDYADQRASLRNNRTFEWIHLLGEIVTALVDKGLRIVFLHEHDTVVWPMFKSLVKGEDGLYRWPRERWLPLSYSISAVRE